MKAKLLFAALLVLAGSPSFAQPGGEGSNTGCQGQGNPNSPCTPGSGGGGTTPGTGGTTITNTTTATATASATAAARARQRQTQTATGGNASTGPVSVNNTIQTGNGTSGGGSRTVTVRNVPDIYAPSIGGGSNPRVVGASGGVGGPGWGFSLGLTVNDAGCERRNLAIVLTQMGHNEGALEVLCADGTVREAMSRAGRPCAADRAPPAQVVTPAPQALPTPPRNVPAFCRSPGLQVQFYPECR